MTSEAGYERKGGKGPHLRGMKMGDKEQVSKKYCQSDCQVPYTRTI